MVNFISAIGSEGRQSGQSESTPKIIPKQLQVPKRDSVILGARPVSQAEAQRIVLERALEKLAAVVGEARAELGLPEGVVLDTSAEATAGRIADFALGFFSKYAEQNGLADNEAGRQLYADFIGEAIDQGIAEARDILGALSALSPDINANISKTSDIVHQRLNFFVANGLGN
jgi:hypothetical protein